MKQLEKEVVEKTKKRIIAFNRVSEILFYISLALFACAPISSVVFLILYFNLMTHEVFTIIMMSFIYGGIAVYAFRELTFLYKYNDLVFKLKKNRNVVIIQNLEEKKSEEVLKISELKECSRDCDSYNSSRIGFSIVGAIFLLGFSTACFIYLLQHDITLEGMVGFGLPVICGAILICISKGAFERKIDDRMNKIRLYKDVGKLTPEVNK